MISTASVINLVDKCCEIVIGMFWHL